VGKTQQPEQPFGSPTTAKPPGIRGKHCRVLSGQRRGDSVFSPVGHSRTLPRRRRGALHL